MDQDWSDWREQTEHVDTTEGERDRGGQRGENGAVGKAQIEEQKPRKVRLQRRWSALADKSRCGAMRVNTGSKGASGKLKRANMLRGRVNRAGKRKSKAEGGKR